MGGSRTQSMRSHRGPEQFAERRPSAPKYLHIKRGDIAEDRFAGIDELWQGKAKTISGAARIESILPDHRIRLTL